MKHSTRRRLGAAAGALALLAALTACGDDGGGEVSLDEWVAEFDQLCEEVAAESPDLSEEEFEVYSAEKVAEMRAFGAPSEMAEEAETVLDSIEATTSDPDLTDEEIAALDEQAFEALTALGVSETCIGGAS